MNQQNFKYSLSAYYFCGKTIPWIFVLQEVRKKSHGQDYTHDDIFKQKTAEIHMNQKDNQQFE